ncbi:D-arabinono-1,4-lactone oxidase-domain-containing protein [Mycena latifolia]|nr:D-arabinono-1,4-lactone oxidase-domain-containing protein [Mycena latifolia]
MPTERETRCPRRDARRPSTRAVAIATVLATLPGFIRAYGGSRRGGARANSKRMCAYANGSEEAVTGTGPPDAYPIRDVRGSPRPCSTRTRTGMTSASADARRNRISFSDARMRTLAALRIPRSRPSICETRFAISTRVRVEWEGRKEGDGNGNGNGAGTRPAFCASHKPTRAHTTRLLRHAHPGPRFLKISCVALRALGQSTYVVFVGARHTTFTATLYSTASATARYADETGAGLREVCVWRADVGVLPTFQAAAQTHPAGGFYTDFEVGLELDSAEVRGVLVCENVEWGRVVFAPSPPRRLDQDQHLHAADAGPDPCTLPRAALVAALAPITTAHPVWQNWGRTFLCTPLASFAPRTTYHCRLALALAAHDRRRLRPAGIGHSPSDLACTRDYMLLMTAFNRVLHVDRDKCCVTAQAGITLTDLHAALAPHGLAMRNLGSISDQTLAGIVATATHGSGVSFGVMSTHVLALTLLLPSGAVVACSPTRNKDLFTASICGLGATGLILTITLELEPAFRLRDEHTMMPVRTEHVRFWWFPAVGAVRVSAASRTSEPANPAASWFWDSLVGFHAVQLLLLLTRYARCEPLAFLSVLLAPLSPSLHSVLAASGEAEEKAPSTALARLAHARPLGSANVWAARLACWLAGPRSVAVDESYRIFNIECRYLQHTTEWALPAARAAPCLRALGAWLEREQGRRGGERPHFPIEVRFSAADDIWLSPSSGGETCWIGIVQYKPYDLPTRYRALFAEFERILAVHGGRPHWAKAHHLDARATRALYPAFGRFLKVVEEVDPEGIFRNEYIERHLMGGTGDGREYKVWGGSGPASEGESEGAGAEEPAGGSAQRRRWSPWTWWRRGTQAEAAEGDWRRDWRVAPPWTEELDRALERQDGRGAEEQDGEGEDGEEGSDADSEATLASAGTVVLGKLDDPASAPSESPPSSPAAEWMQSPLAPPAAEKHRARTLAPP